MSLLRQQTRRIVFAARYLVGESLRMARAIRMLDGVLLFGICESRSLSCDIVSFNDDRASNDVGASNDDGAPVFADIVCIEDVHDADRLIEAVRELAEKHGPMDHLVTATETLLEPVARANEALGIEGMSVSTVLRTLDKSRLKAALGRAGIDTPRDQIVTDSQDAKRFVSQAGLPIVLKPFSGSGALATLRIRSFDNLDLALELMNPTPEKPVLAEAYLSGQELCIDTITIGSEPRFHSICCYSPSILEAVEDPRIQWRCVMPREIDDDRYGDFIEQGLRAVRALSVGNAITHMEGFLVEGGKPFFTDATLRPAGARIGPMLAFAYDIDPYLAWARVAVDGCFDGPWERRYAVGTIFLRGAGTGQVEEVEGIETVNRQLGDLVMESRLPRTGAARSVTYTGDGYITIRHPDTRFVEDALRWIAQTLRITYTHPESRSSKATVRERWSKRLQGSDKQMSRPVWEDDFQPRLDRARGPL